MARPESRLAIPLAFVAFLVLSTFGRVLTPEAFREALFFTLLGRAAAFLGVAFLAAVRLDAVLALEVAEDLLVQDVRAVFDTAFFLPALFFLPDFAAARFTTCLIHHKTAQMSGILRETANYRPSKCCRQVPPDRWARRKRTSTWVFSRIVLGSWNMRFPAAVRAAWS